MALFIFVMLILSIFLPYVNNDLYLAATVVAVPTETKKKKTVGHKVEGAEYNDELWGKFRVIAVDNGGGSGEGGGAGDSNTSNAGNSGSYNDAGGTFGDAAGVGLGSGNTKNKSGEGSGNKGGSTGSAKADALRALRAQIEESKAESLAKVLATAENASQVAASIAEQESIQESIQKKIQQESIKAKITQAETRKQYETPVYIEETIRQYISNLDLETVMPTQKESYNYIDLDNNLSPTSEIVYNDAESIKYPTSEQEEKIEETLQFYDSPMVFEETNKVVEEEMSVENNNALEQINQSKNDVKSDIEEGQGSKGGKDAEALEDMKGDDGQNSTEGNAKEKGKTQQETKGEFAAKKVFELKQNGNLGFEPEHLSIQGVKSIIDSAIMICVLSGALIFVFGCKDKTKWDKYF